MEKGRLRAPSRRRPAGAARALPHGRLEPVDRARDLARRGDARPISKRWSSAPGSQVYGPRQALRGWLRGFLGGGWSAAVRAIWLESVIALAVMVAGTLAGWLLVAQRPRVVLQRWSPRSSPMRACPAPAARCCAPLDAADSAGRGSGGFAAYLFSNNAQRLDPGLRAGLRLRHAPRCCCCVQNMATLGAMLWLYHGPGCMLDLPLAFGPRHDRAVRDPAGGGGGAPCRPGDGLSRRPRGAGRRRRGRAPRRAR